MNIGFLLMLGGIVCVLILVCFSLTKTKKSVLKDLEG